MTPRVPRHRTRDAVVALGVVISIVAGACGRSASPVTAARSGRRAAAGACTTATAVASWPLTRRVAQLIVVPALNFDVRALQPLVAQGVGGILFLGPGPAPADLGSVLATEDRVAPGGVAPLTMADEEGGGIQRLAGTVPAVPWARQLATTDTAAEVEALGQTVGRAMRRAGVDVDLAPVLDVDGGPGPSATDPDGERSFSADPAVAARDGTAFLTGLVRGGVLPVAKHFPGLGRATGNTDDGPAATPPLTTLQGAGLVPFRAAIAAGAPAVMVANATVPGLTNEPASLSSAVVTGLLRRAMGFNGLVLTDSLSAGAVAQAGYDLAQAAVAAVQAGVDLVLFGSTASPAQTQALEPGAVGATTGQLIAALTAAVRAGAIPETQLDAAVAAVVRAKHLDLCRGHTG